MDAQPHNRPGNTEGPLEPFPLPPASPREGTNPKDLIGLAKPPLHLVPPAGLILTSLAMGDGAKKYGAFNWRDNDVRATVYVAAALRHLMSWSDGEDLAVDSNRHHLAHAAACLFIIMDAEATGNLVDDRPPPGAAARLIAAHTRSA